MDEYSGQVESDFQATDTQRQFRYKSGISGKLRFERLNEVTWKLTNGEMTNVPACHGFWGGYRTSKAIAWVIQVEGKLACPLQRPDLESHAAQ